MWIIGLSASLFSCPPLELAATIANGPGGRNGHGAEKRPKTRVFFEDFGEASLSCCCYAR